jgi:hypothetical protein
MEARRQLKLSFPPSYRLYNRTATFRAALAVVDEEPFRRVVVA